MQKIRITKTDDEVKSYLKQGENWVLLEEVMGLVGDFDIQFNLEKEEIKND